MKKIRIVEMYESGYTWEQIRDDLDLNKDRLIVYKSILTKYYPIKNQLQKLRDQGLKLQDIAAELDIPRHAVSMLTIRPTKAMTTLRKKELEAERKKEFERLKASAREKYYIDHNEPLSGCGELPEFLRGIGPVKISGKPNRMAGIPEHLHGKKREDDPKGEAFYVSKKFR